MQANSFNPGSLSFGCRKSYSTDVPILDVLLLKDMPRINLYYLVQAKSGNSALTTSTRESLDTKHSQARRGAASRNRTNVARALRIGLAKVPDKISADFRSKPFRINRLH